MVQVSCSRIRQGFIIILYDGLSILSYVEGGDYSNSLKCSNINHDIGVRIKVKYNDRD